MLKQANILNAYLLWFFFFFGVNTIIINAEESKSMSADNSDSTDKPLTNKLFFNELMLKDSIVVDESVKPGKYYEMFTPEQDSAYFKALKLRAPVSVKISNDLKMLSGLWEIHRQMAEENPWAIAKLNMQIPSEYLVPRGQEIVQRQMMIMESQRVPFMKTVNPLASMGVSVSLESIGRFLGIVEDVSPVLKFQIDYEDEVEIVIYSIQAMVISTIYKGMRPAGNYTYTWNGRDDNGKPVPSGDYIGEIRIGKNRFVRKRIYIP